MCKICEKNINNSGKSLFKNCGEIFKYLWRNFQNILTLCKKLDFSIISPTEFSQVIFINLPLLKSNFSTVSTPPTIITNLIYYK